MKRIQRIGILTGGGDAPGLNTVVRGVVKAGIHTHGWNDVSGILTQGGTILGTTNRDNPFAYVDDHRHPDRRRDASPDVVRHYRKLRLDALVAVGGDGTLQCAYNMSKLGLRIVGVPKTIDNDVRGTDLTFGFNTAVTTATEAVDKLHTTAASHHRVMILEVMGRTAGWLALTAGVAGGGDLVVRDRVAGSFEAVRLGGVSAVLAKQIEAATGIETRYTILGHLQRGGTPTPFDRYLATQLATGAVEMLAGGQFNQMVCVRAGKIGRVSLRVPGTAPRLVSPRSHAIRMARSLGTSFGDQ